MYLNTNTQLIKALNEVLNEQDEYLTTKELKKRERKSIVWGIGRELECRSMNGEYRA